MSTLCTAAPRSGGGGKFRFTLLLFAFGALGAPIAALASPGSAPSPVVQDFKQSSHQILKALLQDQHISAVGQLDLAEFDAEIDRQRVTHDERGFTRKEQTPGCGTAYRSSAEWFSDLYGTMIIVNDRLWPGTSADAKGVLSIHENLGVKHLQDHNCEISCGLWLLGKPETVKALTPEERSMLLDHVGRQTLTRIADGGVTGVGGGGDSRAFQAKLQRLEGDLGGISAAKNKDRREAAVQTLLGDLDGEFEMARAGAADARKNFTPEEDKEYQGLCATLANLPPSIQLRAFEILTTNHPDTLRKVPNVDAMVGFCAEFAKSRNPGGRQ